MKPIRNFSYSLALLIMTSCLPASAQATKAPDDPLLRAMLTELQRSTEKLKLEKVAAPYYIEYRLTDLDDLTAETAFGAVSSENHSRVRFLRVVVRVGDYKQDNSFGQGEGILNLAPLEDDALALRHSLWLATDRAYKQASEALAQKQAYLKQLNVEIPVDDFAKAPAMVSIGETAKLVGDLKPHIALLVDATALYRTHPEIETLTGFLHFTATTRYFVNSEGTIVRDGHKSYLMAVSASAQAEDGMRLERGSHALVGNISELPSRAEWLTRTAKALDGLEKLRQAPVVDEEYRGPVLFSPAAASDVVEKLIGDNALGQRPELGKPARTAGEWASEYKSRVLPEFLSVTDDPSLTNFKGHSLLGNYVVDDEGVKAETVKLIDKGKLVNYVTSRQPIRDFPTSNGHGRGPMFGSPTANFGTLVVEASPALSPDELKKKVVELCRQHDLPYGFFVESLGQGLKPRVLYRIWAKDGREELVRGASFSQLDTRSLRNDLIAAGNDAEPDNGNEPVLQSIITPSLLLEELEVKRANDSKEKLPEYPAPTLAAKK